MWYFGFLFLICVGICANQNTAIRRMITEVNAANEGKIVRRDGREEGIARVDTTWAIIAEERESSQMSTFCGGGGLSLLGDLTDYRLFFYTVPKAEEASVHNVTFCFPNSWFQDKSIEIRLQICLQGTVFEADGRGIARKEVVQLFITGDHLVQKDHETYFTLDSNYLKGNSFASAALILDNVWNLPEIPQDSISVVVMRVVNIKKMFIHKNVCNQHLGRDQPCCRWPFRNPHNKTEVLFHRCLDLVSEKVIAPQRYLETKGESRLRYSSDGTMCRTSKTELVTWSYQRDGEDKAQVYREYNALECVSNT